MWVLDILEAIVIISLISFFCQFYFLTKSRGAAAGMEQPVVKNIGRRGLCAGCGVCVGTEPKTVIWCCGMVN